MQVDGVLILAARVGPNSNLAAIVLVVDVQLRRLAVADHIHVRTAIGVVFLSVVGRKLVFVLQEGVLGALRAARSVRNVARDLGGTRRCGRGVVGFPRRVDLVEFSPSLVHVRRAWVLAPDARTWRDRTCQRVFDRIA